MLKSTIFSLALGLLFSPSFLWALDAELPAQIGPTFKRFVKNIGGSLNFNPLLFSPDYREQNQLPRNSVALVPYGRSLERRFADDKLPRALISLAVSKDNSTSELEEGYVLIGYTAKNDQLQIIASNNLGRGNGGYNDFILVDDFSEGKKARISYPNGGLCLACHQGGNLLFPTSSWNEITKEHENYSKQKTENKIMSSIAKFKPEVFLFDSVIRDLSNEYSIRQQLKNVCVGDSTCRLSILKLALDLENNLDNVIGYLRSHDNRQALQIPSSFLSPRRKSPNNIQRTYQFPFALGEDPLFPRPFEEGTFSYSTASKSTVLKYIKRFGVIEDDTRQPLPITDSFLNSPFAQDLVLNKWPILRTDLNRSIEQYMTGEQFEPPVNELIMRPLKDPRQIFFRYCYMCHHPGGAVAPLEFDKLKTFVGVANHERTPKNLVKFGIMPPQGALTMSAEERKILLDYLEN